MQIFYCPDIITNTAILSEEESYHCIKVLRLNKGDFVQLIDGKGNIYEACIDEAHPRQCHLEIQSKSTQPDHRSFNLHIAIAPTKNIERFEWFIEKSVEIGIDTITPILCMRSERKVLKIDRLQKLIISTMKQAKITKLPVLNELVNFNAFIKYCTSLEENCFIAHCDKGQKTALKTAFIKNRDVIILIGPEGDFSTEEINIALSKHFVPVSLGATRLRTETAGIIACHSINFMNSDS